jgi:hypothetical protein
MSDDIAKRPPIRIKARVPRWISGGATWGTRGPGKTPNILLDPWGSESVEIWDEATGETIEIGVAASSAGNWPTSDTWRQEYSGIALTAIDDESVEERIKNFLDGVLPKPGHTALTDDDAVKIAIKLIRMKGGDPKLACWASGEVYEHVDPKEAKDPQHVRKRIYDAIRRKLGTFNKPKRKPKERKDAS